MKRIIIYTLLINLLTNFSLWAQNHHDYVWPLGYGKIFYDPNNIAIGGIILDFNTNPPVMSHVDYELKKPLAGICDTSGQLLAYTDGCDIANRTHAIMLNGDTLSPGKVFNKYCDATSYPVWQGALFLPKPSTAKEYYLFHFSADDFTMEPRFFMYSVLDASGNNGLGQVIEKNIAAFEDSELSPYITATRHANGRDWWILSPRRNSNVYQRSLLTPEGVQYVDSQAVGTADPIYWGGQTAFSPDGSLYVKALRDGVRLMDFDRCTGQLSNFRFAAHPDTAGASGAVFAPGGRFLYITTGSRLYQYDLWAPTLEAGRQVVATYDGYQSPFSTAFFQGMAAPDGKLYFSTGSTNNVLHIVHAPDLPGADCQVEQHGLQLPALTGWFVPNYVNYRLGALDCSACDSLNLDHLPQAAWSVAVDTLDPFLAVFHDLSSCTASWHWDFGDGATSTEQHPAHTYTAQGLYTVCLTARNPNGTSIRCDTIRVGFTAWTDPGMQRRVEVWPNPFREQINVAWSARLPGPVFRLYDQLGRVALSAPIRYGINELDMDALPPGMYVWDVWARGERVKAGKAVKTGI